MVSLSHPERTSQWVLSAILTVIMLLKFQAEFQAGDKYYETASAWFQQVSDKRMGRLVPSGGWGTKQ